MRVFIVGPLPGTEGYDPAEYNKAEKLLTRAGHFAVNLSAIYEKNADDFHKIAKKQIERLIDCEGIYLLESSNESNGGTLPRLLAAACGIPEITIKLLSNKWT